MAFLDNFKEKAKDLANTGVAQSKRLAAIAKLKTENMTEEDSIKRSYIQLGKAYFAEHSGDATGDLAVLCDKIIASQAIIETNNQKIDELNGKDDDTFNDSDIVAEVEAVDVENVEDETKE